MAHFSLCSPAHTRVELAGHSEHAPEVLTEGCEGGLGQREGRERGLGTEPGPGLPPLVAEGGRACLPARL